jgi:hypothetical protein
MEIKLTLVELTLLKRLLTAQLMQSQSKAADTHSDVVYATLPIRASSMSGSALRVILEKIQGAISNENGSSSD